MSSFWQIRGAVDSIMLFQSQVAQALYESPEKHTAAIIWRRMRIILFLHNWEKCALKFSFWACI